MKILVSFLVSVSLSFSILFNSNAVLPTCSQKTFSVNSEIYSDVDWVEYIYVDGLWYQITHYTDSSIGVVQVAHPPVDGLNHNKG
jgi:hypothetical protein